LAISIGKEISKGSARSIKGLNITEVLRSCKDILIDVGGHSAAAGFSLRSEHIVLFAGKVEEVMQRTEIEDPGDFLDIDLVLPQGKITKSLCRKIDEFEPFGLNNPKPIFATLNAKVSDIRTVGSGKHLKFKADGIDAIAFNMGELEPFLQTGQIVNMAYNLEINRFNGNETLQFKVKDLQLN
jgi:single-stranded-DNA-specific exonuclease